MIETYSKYDWIAPLKDKKSVTVVNAFQKVLDESKRSKAKSKGGKPNNIWVDKGSEFYNSSFKK